MHNSILINEGIYHVFNKSIAGFKIFNNHSEFLRMQQIIRYYRLGKPGVKFSQYISYIINSRCAEVIKDSLSGKERIVDIIAYCIMPTHIHLILKQTKEKGISIFMSNILNSYSRYFNIKYGRKGPLWESRFKRIVVTIDEHLLHLTRYIHLNPVTAYLVNKPEEWIFSSYNEYVCQADDKERICDYDNIIEITPGYYKKFVEDNIDYQRELAEIKFLLLEHNPNSTS